jgi:hypothetical protein
LYTVQEPVHAELFRLSKRFGLKPDLETDDGQRFLYSVNKSFEDLWPLLNVFDFPKMAVTISEPKTKRSYFELTQQALLEGLPRDMRVEHVLSSLVSWRNDEVKADIRETTSYYNILVGNQVRGQPLSYKKNKKLIPVHYLIAWCELRFVHSKFLACAILSHINWCKWVCHRLTTRQPLTFTCRRSSHFSEILEICDHGSPFLYQSALGKYNELIGQIHGIASYFIVAFEASPSETGLIDRPAIIEKLLEYEFKLLTQRGQPLMLCSR